MTDEELRIRVAELYGWTHIHIDRDWMDSFDDFNSTALVGVPPGATFVGSGSYEEIPNYPNDLNAMHEAEKILLNKDPQWKGFASADRYFDKLASVVGYNTGIMPLVFATARQRAEALVKTMEGS